MRIEWIVFDYIELLMYNMVQCGGVIFDIDVFDKYVWVMVDDEFNIQVQIVVIVRNMWFDLYEIQILMVGQMFQMGN